jgi:hypothetical protein
MKKMHHTFRVISLGIGLALLVVTGTAAMIGAFSGPVSAPGLYPPVVIAPAAGALPPHSGDDSVLYERVARSDGSHRWVLTQEPASSGIQPGDREALAAVAAPDANLQQVSFALPAKPAGFSKAPKTCTSPAHGSNKAKAFSTYDISCISMG